jgi:hypothetical protein
VPSLATVLQVTGALVSWRSSPSSVTRRFGYMPSSEVSKPKVRAGTLWYYDALIEAYREAKPPVRPPAALVAELERTLRELKRLVRVAGG